jgi:putative FmdB family regulatory protein
MPIYEYKCNKCGVVEVTQRITEAPLKKCPNCRSKVERLVSRSSFVLKGTGWYATDYANKGKRTDSDSAATNGSGSSDSKGDSKPASDSKSSADKGASAKAAD